MGPSHLVRSSAIQFSHPLLPIPRRERRPSLLLLLRHHHLRHHSSLVVRAASARPTEEVSDSKTNEGGRQDAHLGAGRRRFLAGPLWPISSMMMVRPGRHRHRRSRVSAAGAPDDHICGSSHRSCPFTSHSTNEREGKSEPYADSPLPSIPLTFPSSRSNVAPVKLCDCDCRLPRFITHTTTASTQARPDIPHRR